MKKFFKGGEIKREDVNAFLRRFLPYYFFGIWIFIVIGAWHQVGFHEGFNIGDWLINYEGGFVRRGFVGECLYLLARLTGVTPVIYLVIFQGIIFAVYFYYSWRMLKEKSDLVKYAFLIFSPFLFTFAINSQAGGYRKEIIYFAVLSYVTYAYSFFDSKKFERVFSLVLLFYPLVILTDELGLVILPLLFALYWEKLKMPRGKILLRPVLLLLLNGFFFLLVFFHHRVSHEQVDNIVRSILSVGYDPHGSGAIGALGATTSSNMKDTFHSIVYAHYFSVYPLALFLCSLAFVSLGSELRQSLRSRPLFLGLLFSFFLLIPVYIIANDWGRWTYILMVEIFMVIVAEDKDSQGERLLSSRLKWQQVKLPVFIIFVFALMSYSAFWYLPHVLEDGSSWRSFIHNVPFIRG